MVNRIRKVGDYANLILLQKANEKFQSARGQFKKKKWKEAKNQYEDYIENYNKIDFDAYYELAFCYAYLAVLIEEKQQSKKSDEKKKSKEDFGLLYEKSIQNFHKARECDRKNRLLRNGFVDIVVQKKGKRKIINEILEVKCKLSKDAECYHFLQAMGRIMRK